MKSGNQNMRVINLFYIVELIEFIFAIVYQIAYEYWMTNPSRKVRIFAYCVCQMSQIIMFLCFPLLFMLAFLIIIICFGE